LDYSEDLMGGGFRFHNPNAAQSCSCGNSFSIKE
jgi:iron-sulfur cluster assembly protein